MFLAINDILSWALPIALGLLVGYMIATRGKNKNVDTLIFMSAEDFRQNMRKGQLIDVRTEDAFKTERINGSRNFPKRQILSNLSKIRTDQPVFLYGDADNGVVRRVGKKLGKKGFYPIYVLKEGFENWPFSKKSN